MIVQVLELLGITPINDNDIINHDEISFQNIS